MPRNMFLCLLAIGLLTIDTAAQESKLQDALLAQEAKLIRSIKMKDKAAIAELLADEAISITASRGRQTANEIVAGLEDISFTDYKISEPKTISVSPDVAILTYKFSWTGGVTGQTPTTTTAYATSMWRQRGGQWRSVLYQETPVIER
jgi:ketosteroid isomerase-like protein